MTFSALDERFTLDGSENDGMIGHRPRRGPSAGRSLTETKAVAYSHKDHAISTLQLCKQAHATTAYAASEFDADRVLLHGGEVDAGVNDVCGFVALNDADKVVGLIFGYRTYNFININSMAIDRAFYVAPEYRSLATFDALLTAFEQWAAEDAWCKQVIISVTEMDRCNAVHRLLRRRGYSLKYRQFGKEL